MSLAIYFRQVFCLWILLSSLTKHANVECCSILDCDIIFPLISIRIVLQLGIAYLGIGIRQYFCPFALWFLLEAINCLCRLMLQILRLLFKRKAGINILAYQCQFPLSICVDSLSVKKHLHCYMVKLGICNLGKFNINNLLLVYMNRSVR